jgi:hypothetical protein
MVAHPPLAAKPRLPKRGRVPFYVPLPDIVDGPQGDARACGRRFRIFNVVYELDRERCGSNDTLITLEPARSHLRAAVSRRPTAGSAPRQRPGGPEGFVQRAKAHRMAMQHIQARQSQPERGRTGPSVDGGPCRWLGWRRAVPTKGRTRLAQADECHQLRGPQDLRHQGAVRGYRLGDTGGGAGPRH